MNTEKLIDLFNLNSNDNLNDNDISFDDYVAEVIGAIVENQKLDYFDSTLLETVVDHIYCTLGIILRTNRILNNKINRVGEIIAVKTIN